MASSSFLPPSLLPSFPPSLLPDAGVRCANVLPSLRSFAADGYRWLSLPPPRRSSVVGQRPHARAHVSVGCAAAAAFVRLCSFSMHSTGGGAGSSGGSGTSVPDSSRQFWGGRRTDAHTRTLKHCTSRHVRVRGAAENYQCWKWPQHARSTRPPPPMAPIYARLIVSEHLY